MDEETEGYTMAGPIARALNGINQTLRTQGGVVRDLSRNVARNTPDIRRLARNEDQVVLPRTRNTYNGVLELQRESVPRLQNQNNNISRDVTQNGLETERVRDLLIESMAKNAECCEELSTQGDRNRTLIQNNLTLEFKNELNIATNNVNVQFNNVNTNITNNTRNTNNLIGVVKTTITNNFNTLRINLRAQFSQTSREITLNRNVTNEVYVNLRAHISLEVGYVINNLRIAVTTLSAEISAVFTLAGSIEISVGAVIAQITQFQININGYLTVIAGEVRSVQYFVNKNIDKSSYKLNQTIILETQRLDSNIRDELKEINKKLDELGKQQVECCDKLPRRLGEVVSDYVIGESYYRWDATSTYFCTLIFKFKETNVDTYAKVSQLKIRLKQRNEEITDSDIQDLRARASSLEGLEYTYGRVRAYYVSPDKRFKTSLFSNSREDAYLIYTNTLSYINDVFDSKNVSFTEKIERENNTSRKYPLDGIPVNKYNYKQPIHQKLFKIVLIVNGISRPITICQYKP